MGRNVTSFLWVSLLFIEIPHMSSLFYTKSNSNDIL